MNSLQNILLHLDKRHGQDILDMAQYLGAHSGSDSKQNKEIDPTVRSSKRKQHSTAPGIVHAPNESQSPGLPSSASADSELLEHLLKSANVSRSSRDSKRAHRTAPPSSQRRSIEFTLPSIPIVILTLGGLAMLTYLSLTQSENGFVQWVFWAIPQCVFRFSAKALLAVHAFEAFVMLLACRSLRRRSRFDLDTPTVLLYTASTLVFGVFACLALVRNMSR